MKSKEPSIPYVCRACGKEIRKVNVEDFKSLCSDCWYLNKKGKLDSTIPYEEKKRMDEDSQTMYIRENESKVTGVFSLLISLILTPLLLIFGFLTEAVGMIIFSCISLIILEPIALILGLKTKKNRKRLGNAGVYLSLGYYVILLGLFVFVLVFGFIFGSLDSWIDPWSWGT